MIKFKNAAAKTPTRRPKHRLVKAAEEALAVARGEAPETRINAYMNIRVTVGLLERLDALAVARGMVRSEAVRLAIEEWIKQQEGSKS